MKKFLTIAIAIALAAMIAAPAMATDVTFSGSYRVQGTLAESLDLDERSANDTVMDHRFRLQTKFAVNDMLAVTTRFDALDGTYWGTNGADATSGGPNINWDRTWMSIKTADYGSFDIGRMSGGTWFNSVFDTEVQRDRIKWVYSGIENWTFFFIYDARIESDGGSYTTIGIPAVRNTYRTGEASDQDRNDYYPAFVYKAENWSFGMLYGYIHNKTVANTATVLHLFDPEFKGQWGPLAVQAALVYLTGESDIDGATPDVDWNGWGWNLEGTYDFGPAKLMLGAGFQSGEDLDATQISRWPFGFGRDWNYPLLIMTGNDGPWLDLLGNGAGNLGNNAYQAGAMLFYGGVSFAPIETVTLGANFGFSNADETENIGPGIDDDQGAELDFILNWKIYDNLTYKAVFAYYWAGDLYRDCGGIPNANFDDATGFYNSLVMSF
ncbi:MAG: hypothetical protein ABII68_03045 [Pseudomonadota bacterium]